MKSIALKEENFDEKEIKLKQSPLTKIKLMTVGGLY
jgi:hypothetical protein